MLVVHVNAQIRPESVGAFREASLRNARESLKEPGIATFDVLQQEDEPSRFILVEVYRDREAQAAHKQTPHYQAWRDAVAPMMAEPRRSTLYTVVYPGDDGW